LVEIIDADPRAARHREMARRAGLELLPLLPTQAREERIEQRNAGEMLTASDAIEPGCEPVVDRRRERRVSEVRPALEFTAQATQEADARLQIARLAAPRQGIDSELADSLQHGGARLLPRHFGQ